MKISLLANHPGLRKKAIHPWERTRLACQSDDQSRLKINVQVRPISASEPRALPGWSASLQSIAILFVTLLILNITAFAQRARITKASRIPVILLSIDGLKPDYVLEADKHNLKIPNLRRLAKRGAYASGVVGVTPTVTYPSHTTLVTGVSPARHGILSNTPFDPFSKNLGGWYWYAESIKTPTLWDAANKAGLVTASIDWPVTVGADIKYNIAQYWRAATEEDHKLLRALSTKGLLVEAEKDCGLYPAAYEYDLQGDQRRAKFIAWMLEKKQPDFLTCYFSALDEEQHAFGPYTKETFETLEELDALVGEILAAAERTYKGSFVLCIVSDHGHIRTEKELHLNAALQSAGLIEIDDLKKMKSWRAVAWNAGASIAVMLKDKNDDETRGLVRELLGKLAADADNGIERVFEGSEARALGGFPDAAFIVALKPGFRTGGSLSGATVRNGKIGGTHGYLPVHRDMEASFFLSGSGIPTSRDLGQIDMRDVAPTLAHLMKLALPAAEGRNLLTETKAARSLKR